jgi:GNAT superfamily N-acetyltransferase
MGISAIKVCKECGMQYNTTLAEDRRSHEKHHNGVVEAKQPNTVPAGSNLMDKYVGDAHHLIRVIDHRGSAALKQGVEKALEVTRHDLGGWILSPQKLWAEITNPHNKNDPNHVPRYKVYLYLINLQVVGLVLAERIARGGAYYHGPMIIDEYGGLPNVGVSEHSSEEQEFVYSDFEYKCYMSIDRIWTRRDFRRNGIATLLVDHARQSFVPGLSLSKEQIAFSRPTSAGREFATKYCEDVSFKGGPFLSDLDSAEVVVKDDKFNVC